MPNSRWCRPRTPPDSTYARTLIVTGYDRLHRFRRGRHTRSFINIRDSELAESMARELSLRAPQILHA